MRTNKNFRIMVQLLTAAFVAAAPCARATIYDVFAQANSSSGGAALNTISLTAGEIFSVSVSPTDLWSAGELPRWSNADGLIKYLYATGSDESGQPVNTLIGQPFPYWTQNGFTAPYGALVGRIGGSYLLIGTSFRGPAPASGVLQLMYWDSNNGDNVNKVAAVAALVTQVPEPTTILAGALLLLPFGASTLRILRRRQVA